LFLRLLFSSSATDQRFLFQSLFVRVPFLPLACPHVSVPRLPTRSAPSRRCSRRWSVFFVSTHERFWGAPAYFFFFHRNTPVILGSRSLGFYLFFCFERGRCDFEVPRDESRLSDTVNLPTFLPPPLRFSPPFHRGRGNPSCSGKSFFLKHRDLAFSLVRVWLEISLVP